MISGGKQGGGSSGGGGFVGVVFSGLVGGSFGGGGGSGGFGGKVVFQFVFGIFFFGSKFLFLFLNNFSGQLLFGYGVGGFGGVIGGVVGFFGNKQSLVCWFGC